MQIDVAKLDWARIRTTNGDLRLTATLAAGTRLDAKGIDGRMRVTLREPNNCFGSKPCKE